MGASFSNITKLDRDVDERVLASEVRRTAGAVLANWSLQDVRLLVRKFRQHKAAGANIGWHEFFTKFEGTEEARVLREEYLERAAWHPACQGFAMTRGKTFPGGDDDKLDEPDLSDENSAPEISDDDEFMSDDFEPLPDSGGDDDSDAEYFAELGRDLAVQVQRRRKQGLPTMSGAYTPGGDSAVSEGAAAGADDDSDAELSADAGDAEDGEAKGVEADVDAATDTTKAVDGEAAGEAKATDADAKASDADAGTASVDGAAADDGNAGDNADAEGDSKGDAEVSVDEEKLKKKEAKLKRKAQREAKAKAKAKAKKEAEARRPYWRPPTHHRPLLGVNATSKRQPRTIERGFDPACTNPIFFGYTTYRKEQEEQEEIKRLTTGYEDDAQFNGVAMNKEATKLKQELKEIEKRRTIRERKYTVWRERMITQRTKRAKDREAAERVLEEDELEEFQATWEEQEGPAQEREAKEDAQRYKAMMTDLQADRERAWVIVQELAKLPESFSRMRERPRGKRMLAIARNRVADCERDLASAHEDVEEAQNTLAELETQAEASEKEARKVRTLINAAKAEIRRLEGLVQEAEEALVVAKKSVVRARTLLDKEERYAPLFRALRDTTAPDFNPRRWSIRLWEALCAAVMLCKEPLKNKLQFLHELADNSYSGQVGYTEYAALVSSMVRAIEKIGLLPQTERMNDHALSSFLHRGFNIAARESGYGFGSIGYLDGYVSGSTDIASSDVRRGRGGGGGGIAARNAAQATIQRASTPPMPPHGVQGPRFPSRSSGSAAGVVAPWVPGAPPGAGVGVDGQLMLGGPHFKRAVLHSAHGFRYVCMCMCGCVCMRA